MTPSVLQLFSRETTPAMASWLSDDDEKTEAERMEDKNYESDLDWEERPSFFAIHPKILRTVMQPIEMNQTDATPAEVEAPSADLLIPKDDDKWHKQFGMTDGKIWAHSLQSVIGNTQQPRRRSARIAKKAGLDPEGLATKAPVPVKTAAVGFVLSEPITINKPTILFLPTEILRNVVKQIRERNTLIPFALTCKMFAVVVFKVYSSGDRTWYFSEWRGFDSDYDCNRSSFLLSLPMVDWMPLNLKYCRHCDKWCRFFSGAKRKEGEYNNLVEPCLSCRQLMADHRDHFHPQECYDLDTCARYSDWDLGTPKKKNWAKNAWQGDLAASGNELDGDSEDEDDDISKLVKYITRSDSGDDGDDDDDEKDDSENDDEKDGSEDDEEDSEDDCFMCGRGLTCGKH